MPVSCPAYTRAESWPCVPQTLSPANRRWDRCWPQPQVSALPPAGFTVMASRNISCHKPLQQPENPIFSLDTHEVVREESLSGVCVGMGGEGQRARLLGETWSEGTHTTGLSNIKTLVKVDIGMGVGLQVKHPQEKWGVGGFWGFPHPRKECC